MSPSVLRELHAADLRQARNRMISRSAIAIAALLVWYAIDRRIGSGALALAGLFVYQAGVAIWLWRGVRRADPLAPRPESDQIAIDRRRDLELAHATRMAATPPVATFGIVAVVVVVSLIAWVASAPIERAVAIAGLVKPAVSAGEWWRLLSSTFLHAGVFHLWMNMAALIALGRLVEAYASRVLLLVTYLVAGVVGSLASWLLMPQTSSLGASGAIMGLAGFMAAFAWRRRAELPPGLWQSPLLIIALTGYIGALGFRSIDNAAHAGGAMAGALIGLAVPLVTPSRRRVSTAVPAVAGTVAALILFTGAARTSWRLTEFKGDWTSLLSEPAPIVPITSVHLAIDDPSTASIHNTASRPLEAYEFVVFQHGKAIKHIWRDDCCFPMTNAHPVSAGEKTSVALNLERVLPPQELLTGAFLIAVFDDGSFQGSRSEFDRVQERRREVLEEADFWIKTIQELARRSPADAVTELVRQVSARRLHSQFSSGALEVFGIGKLVEVGKNAPGQFMDAAVNVRAGLLASRAALTSRLGASAR